MNSTLHELFGTYISHYTKIISNRKYEILHIFFLFLVTRLIFAQKFLTKIQPFVFLYWAYQALVMLFYV